jgi:hypothetical protein
MPLAAHDRDSVSRYTFAGKGETRSPCRRRVFGVSDLFGDQDPVVGDQAIGILFGHLDDASSPIVMCRPERVWTAPSPGGALMRTTTGFGDFTFSALCGKARRRSGRGKAF